MRSWIDVILLPMLVGVVEPYGDRPTRHWTPHFLPRSPIPHSMMLVSSQPMRLSSPS